VTRRLRVFAPIVVAAAAVTAAVLSSALPAFAQTVTRGPFLQIARTDGMTVRWRTSTSADGRVWYGPAPSSLTQWVDDPVAALEHAITIAGLTPDTRYYYAVGTTTAQLAGADSLHWFETSPPAGSTGPVRMWILGDSGLAGPNQNAVRDAYLASPGAADTDVWLMLGDNAYNAGTDAEFTTGLFTPYASPLRTMPLWPTRGNHDVVRAGPNNDYYEFFTLPVAGEAGGIASGTEAYYSFDYANVHFVCLDSEGSDRSATGPMVTWLRQDLAANTADWCIAFWHHPPYTKGSHDSDNVADSGGRMQDMRQNVLPVADSLGVDLVLTGHSHSYERSFLLNGHYGLSSTLTGGMILDGGDGRVGGDGAYEKATPGPAAFEGALYVVAGSGAQISGGTLNHPAMYTSLNVLGSVVLDVAGLEMNLTFLDNTGTVRDWFTVTKASATSAPTAAEEAPAFAVRAWPNPAAGPTEVSFSLPEAGKARVRILDPSGRVVRTLVNRTYGAGTHTVSWDGRGRDRKPVAAGVYFAVVEAGGSLRSVKLVRTK
jgi:hypothetical protein